LNDNVLQMPVDYYKGLYEPLTKMLKSHLPLTALPVRELVQICREQGSPITLNTVLHIEDVFNSGDISGILCTIENDGLTRMSCALSHLIFMPGSPLYPEITDYQRKRAKRIMQLNIISGR